MEVGKAGPSINGAQKAKRVGQLGANPVMQSGAAIKASDTIRAVTPDPPSTPEGHDDTTPNFDRVRRIITRR